MESYIQKGCYNNHHLLAGAMSNSCLSEAFHRRITCERYMSDLLVFYLNFSLLTFIPLYDGYETHGN